MAEASANPNDLVTYSEPHLQTGGLVQFSPCGSYVASAAGYRLILRDVDTLQIVQLYSCIDEIEGLEWSCDSEYVLCSIQKRGTAQVWSLSNKEWHCKIDEGPVGLAHAQFSPDGRHVLATADFRLRITIWSLCDRSVFYIRFPKHVGKGLDFTPDGSIMALAERTDQKDSVGLFDPNGWKPIRQFTVASVDLEDLKWSPNSQVLCVIDTVLQYQVLLYSAAGAHLQTFRPYDNALGVKTLGWHPHSHLLCIGSYDERVRVLNSLTWQRLAEITHPPTVRASFSEDAVVWVEPAPKPARPTAAAAARDGALPIASGYVAQRLPVDVPTQRPNPDKANPMVGVGLLKWARSGKFLATRNDNMPTALWVWDGETLLLHSLLLQRGGVTDAAWHPSAPLLAIATGGSAVYLWSPHGCRVAPLPVSHELRVLSLSWNANGDSLLLRDQDRFCVCFLALPDRDAAEAADEAADAELTFGAVGDSDELLGGAGAVGAAALAVS
jgi:WD40 repeat protein